MQGSDIKAGNNLALKAENEVKLVAAQNTSEQHSNNKNISGSVGISFGTDGLMFNAGLSGGKGHGDGTEVTQTNIHAGAGNKLTISSGSDTTLNGAVASGKQVEVNVGTNGQGNLNIASLQDTSTYHSSQQQMGGSISVGAGKMSGSVSASHSKVDATYASVIEQSGINAGDGGFQVKVNGNTDLKGAKIASTDKAIADGKNSLATQTLTTSDIQNHSSYEAESHSMTMGGGYTGSQVDLNRPGIGYGSAGGSQSSTTQSGISELAGDKSVRSDKDSSNKLAKEWDGQALQQDVTAQAQVMQTAVPQIAKAIGDVATQQMQEALDRGDMDAVEKWKDGGLYRVALHTLLGALSGGAAGATGAAVTAVAVPEIATAIKNLGLPEGITNTLIAAAGTAVGAAAGGAQGAAIGFNQTANNFLKHADAEAMKKEVDQCKAKPGGCQDGEVTDIVKKYKAISDANIAAVDSCVLAGNVKCVQDSLGQVASTSEVKVLPFGYTKLEDTFIGRQNNVITYGAVRGDASLFGSDVDQAREVATFRQNNCSGMAASACDNLVKQAMAYRMGRMLSLAAASSAVAAATNAAKGPKPPAKANLESETTGTGVTKANSGETKPATGVAKTDAETTGGVTKSDQPSSGSGNSASKVEDKSANGVTSPEKPAAVPSKVAEEIEALARIKNNPNGPNLENKVPNSVLNQQAVKDLQNGKIPGTPIGEPWTPREMAASPNPSATAEDFAMQFFGGKKPDTLIGLPPVKGQPCIGCWRAQTSDGTWITYRPAGFASDGTLSTTASVDLNNPATINQLNINKRGKPDIVKLKFPLKGNSGVEK